MSCPTLVSGRNDFRLNQIPEPIEPRGGSRWQETALGSTKSPNRSSLAGKPLHPAIAGVAVFLCPLASLNRGERKVNKPSEGIFARITEATLADSGKDPEEPLTEADLSRWLKLSRQWLATARSAGNGPPYIWLGRGLIRYRRKDVVGWLDQHRVRNTAAYADRLPPRSPGRPKSTAADRKRPEQGGSK